MGSTVTCQKAAAAFRSPAGTPIYLLFESTYENNVTPRTPRWGCYHIGGIEGALKRVFSHAASCEGGMLQTRRGWTSPEAYIADWLRCLAAPTRMPDRTARLWSGTSYLDPISPDRLPEVVALLASYELAETAQALAAGGRAELHLYRDAEAVAALCSGGTVHPWRLIDWTPPVSRTDSASSLAYAPARAPRSWSAPANMLRLDEHNHLTQGTDGSWHFAGWAYEVVANHVTDAWKDEAAAPGQYRRSIPAVRAALRNARPIPEGTRVLVHSLGTMDRHDQQTSAAIRDEHQVVEAPMGFEVPVTPALVRSLASLGRNHVTWLVPPLDAPLQARLFPADMPQRPAAPA